ncbi:MAG: type II toxin-antitoxin system RelE/ParE family toxin [Rickettsiales bacterium]|jgi:proteic killer suppression protein|nr:type II toxin-antitoxin system RelE/ParE family toxin [Rickettsiales bacterium]
MIKSFKDIETEKVFEHKVVRKLPPEILRRALVRLKAIDIALNLADLKEPPSNRLEKLGGNRAGQHSIRINDQWRICFQWTDFGVYDVEITDYH